jgi:hypothetical protein
VNEDKLDQIPGRRFQTLKERLITIDLCLKRQKNLDGDARQELIKIVIEQGRMPSKGITAKVQATLASLFGWKPSDLMERIPTICSSTTDARFLSQLPEMRSHGVLVATEVEGVFDLVYHHFRAMIMKRLKLLSGKLKHIQEQDCISQIRGLAASQRTERKRASFRILVQEMQESKSTVDNS